MFGNFLGKSGDTDKKNDTTALLDKISKMNLTEMRSYVNNKVTGLELSQQGLVGVLEKLTVIGETNSKYYIELEDMDSKKKKGFDLVLLIAKNVHMNADIVEKLQEFIGVYEELIHKYDTENRDIYMSRLSDAVNFAIDNVNKQSELDRKASVLGS